MTPATLDLPAMDQWFPPVGLSGWAGAGKDTVGRVLVEEYGFTRIAFADAVRNFLFEVNPRLSNQVDLQVLVLNVGWAKAKEVDEVRRLLQEVGMAARGAFGEDCWLHASGLQEACRRGRVVVTDVRFPNEALLIRKLGGILVRLNRLGTIPALGHHSDTALDEWGEFDMKLANDSPEDPHRIAGILNRAARVPTSGVSW